MLDQPEDRADPFCRYYSACGGCSLQHLGPASYTALKRGLIDEALLGARVGATPEPMISAHGDGRRRATLHARGKEVGYMAARSHDLVDIAACPILVPQLAERAPALSRTIAATIGDCDIAFTATETGLDVSIRTDKKLKPQRLTLLAQHANLARLSLNGETVLMARPPAVRMGKSMVELPLGSFLQATAMAEDVLGALVLDGIGKAKAVADLFCGMGPFTLRMAEQAKVYAADADKPGIAALQHAVRFTRGLKPVTAKARDLFREPLVPVELKDFDAVVFDPPRAGAEAQARELAKSKVPVVVAVSCEPRTFARDAAILIAGGYGLEKLTPVDQFAWSRHVELVGVFRR
ncbi:MAG: class I SAM-dependent RNA methyltransferase [Hyphomicrobiales bacterium]|nr:MAG: class I SAM-dependent RNA methyltransferase [Hyphomicrobiales bacterium]